MLALRPWNTLLSALHRPNAVDTFTRFFELRPIHFEKVVCDGEIQRSKGYWKLLL